MDAVTLGAIGSILVGLAAAAGALIGQRGANAVNQTTGVLTTYGTLVDNLQEERDKAQAKLSENERLLAAAYAELAGERADKARLQAEIATLTTENATLRQRIADMGGQPA